MRVGEIVKVENFIVTAREIQMFALVSGDFNRAHLDEEYAKGTRFGGIIAHGMLTASYISAALAQAWPGAVYLRQTLNFMRPVRPGDTVAVDLKVLSVTRRDDGIDVEVSTVARNGQDRTVLTGVAVVRLYDSEAGPGAPTVAEAAAGMVPEEV